MRFPPILAALPAWLACHTADGVITPGEGVEFDCGSTLTAADASPPEGEVASQLSAYGAEWAAVWSMTVATSLHDDVGAAVPDLTVQVAYDFAAASVVAVEVSAGEPGCQGTVYSVEVPTDVRLADLDLAFSRAGLFKVASADAVGLYPRWAGTILNPGYGFGFSGDDAVALHDFWFPGLESGVDSVDGGVDGVSGTAGVRFVGSSDIELQGTAEAHPADP